MNKYDYTALMIAASRSGNTKTVEGLRWLDLMNKAAIATGKEFSPCDHCLYLFHCEKCPFRHE